MTKFKVFSRQDSSVYVFKEEHIDFDKAYSVAERMQYINPLKIHGVCFDEHFFTIGQIREFKHLEALKNIKP